MFRRLFAWLERPRASQRLRDAKEAVRAASAAWADARVRGDTRDQHTAWCAYRDAKTDLLRAELGR